MRISQLYERAEIGWVKGLDKNLSPEARNVVSEWQSYNWHTGSLTLSYKENSDVYKEIYNTLEPIRQKMRQKYGPTITLYRGERTYEDDGKERHLESWTASKKEAGFFAGLNTRSGQSRTNVNNYTDEEIHDFQDRLNKNGYVKVGKTMYVRNKEHPQYTNIWQGNELITDMNTDGLEKYLKDAREDKKQYVKKIENEGRVIEKQIPIENIVWITNDLGSTEFIVIRKGLYEELSIDQIHKDYKHGEHEFELYAKDDGKVIGYIIYSTYQETVYVKMIEVADAYRRKGVARKLLLNLQSKYPDTEIDLGSLTTDGAMFVNSLKFKEIPIFDKSIYDKLKSKFDQYMKKVKTVPVEQQGKYWNILNILQDKIDDIERSDEFQNPIKRIIVG